MTDATNLVESWRARAAEYELDGYPGAKVLERCAAELQQVLSTADTTTLSMVAAMQYSGYSDDQLRRLVHDGTITNYGTPRRFRLRRSELPRKANHQPTSFV